MKLHRDKAKPLTKVLCAIAALLGALILLKIAGFFVSTSQARVLGAQADAAGAGLDDLKKVLAETKTMSDEIKKKNLFVLATPQQFPVSEVLGIMGQEALINGKWYKVGDSVAEARIAAIEPTKVKIVWNGQEKEFSPITSGGSGGRPGQPGSVGGRPGPGGPPKMVATGGRRRSGPTADPGLSSEEMAKMREQWKNAATPEEKQRLREAARQRSGRRS